MGWSWEHAAGKVKDTYEKQKSCETEEENEWAGEVGVVHYLGIYPFKRIENGQ